MADQMGLMGMAGAGGAGDAIQILFAQRMEQAHLAQTDALTRLKLQEQADAVRARIEASKQAAADRLEAQKAATLIKMDANLNQLPTDAPLTQSTMAKYTQAGIAPERFAPLPMQANAPPEGIAAPDAGPEPTLPGTVANSPAPNQVQFHRIHTAQEQAAAAALKMKGEDQDWKNSISQQVADMRGQGTISTGNFMLHGKPIVAQRQNGRVTYQGQDVTDQVQPFVPLGQSIVLQSNEGPLLGDRSTRVAKPFTDEQGNPIGAKDTAQDATRKKAAQNVLAHIPELNKEADELDRLGLMGPVGGRWADFLAGRVGAGELAAGNPEHARLLGKFRSDVGLMQSGMAMVHGGVRGGGSPGMIARMEALINAKQMDLALFHGATASFEDWLKGYAGKADEPASDSAPTAQELIKKYGG